MKIHTIIYSLMGGTILLLDAAFAHAQAPAAFGTLFVVNSTDDQPEATPDNQCETAIGNAVCTLRAAIQLINARNNGGDGISFSVTGTITLNSALPDLSVPVTITGPGADQLTVQRSSASGTPEFRIFNVTATGTVNISGLTISNLMSPGNPSQGDPDFTGGGINHNNGTLNVSKCTLSGNGALAGGAIANSTATTNINDSVLFGNRSFVSGGGGYSNSGAAIFNYFGTVNVTNSILSNNDAGSGGGIFNRSPGAVNVTDSTLSGNDADLGGGIANEGTLTLMKSTVNDNWSNSEGGGVINGVHTAGTLTVINSTLNGNSASQGGGIANFGTLNITNSTVSGNGAGEAGGIYSGSGFVGVNGTVNIKSSIVALNGATSSPDVEYAFASAGFNLIGNTDGSTGFTAPTDLTGTTASPLDPKLGPLQDNGGPARTMALLTGSPAIDQGTSNGLTGTLITDQRGVGYKRAINQSVSNAAGGDGTDIGAFEFGAHIKAVSRKAHGSVGNFDISLPLFGPKVGVECRTGGSSKIFQIMMTFPTAVTVGSVSVTPDPKVTGATASVSGASVSGSHVTINLTGVSNAQRITLTLSGVSDGQNTNDVDVPMGVLLGDTNNNGSVASNDVTLTQSKAGQTLNGSNFREDVNHDGSINTTDVQAVQSKVGTKLP